MGRDPASTIHSPTPWRCAGPGQPWVGRTFARLLAASKPGSHVPRRKPAEFWYFWYRCCSWCCESGRRAAHPLTRLFHDTRVASYPSSPGEPRGTYRTGPADGVGVGSLCESVLFSEQGLSGPMPQDPLGSFPKVLVLALSSPLPQVHRSFCVGLGVSMCQGLPCHAQVCVQQGLSPGLLAGLLSLLTVAPAPPGPPGPALPTTPLLTPSGFPGATPPRPKAWLLAVACTALLSRFPTQK